MSKSFFCKLFRQFQANFIENYGVLGIAAAIAVVLKIFLFYELIGVNAHYLVVGLLTCLFTYLLFSSFKNKWIPAGIFLLLSALMFADVTYSSFFNRYLSVNMLGAAEFVGDITASIKEVMRPVNFLMLADAALVIAALLVVRVKKKPGQSAEEAGRRLSRRRKGSLRRRKYGFIRPITGIVLVALLILNPLGGGFAKSISNQEFYTYHIKDILGGDKAASENMAAFTDSYDQEKDGPLFGTAEGRNLIVIQIESLQNFVVGLNYNGQEITPNLNALIESDSLYFDNYYQQVGSGNTSDAEFATNNSIYGSLTSYTYKLFNQNYFRGLPVQLKERGYSTAVFHAHEDRSFWSRETMYPAAGFDRYYGGLAGRGGDYEMTEWMGWGLTDSEFFPQTIDYMKELAEPFYSFIITISNHHPYQMLDKYDFIDLLPEDEGTIVGNYLNSAAYTDYAIGQFLEELKANGMYDNSVIALYGDHVGMTHSDEIDASMEQILGKPYDFEDLMNVPLIIHIPGTGVQETISISGGQLDFLPTMAYLLGFETLDTIYLGHNLLTVDSGFVAEQTYMTKGSFFADDIAYEMARDGVFENGRAWNTKTGEAVPLEQCYDGYIRSTDIVNTSEYVLKSDAIRKIYLEGQSAKEAASFSVGRTCPEEIADAGYPDADLLGTNSIEALDYSYEQGYRTLRLAVDWNEDSEPITVNQRTGEVEIESEELIAWLENHGGVSVVMDVGKSGDWLINYVGQESPSVKERMILELPDTEEYTGRYEAILDVSTSGQTLETIRTFMERNSVWAVKLSAEDAAGSFAPLLDLKTTVYIEGDDGRITRGN